MSNNDAFAVGHEVESVIDLFKMVINDGSGLVLCWSSFSCVSVVGDS